MPRLPVRDMSGGDCFRVAATAARRIGPAATVVHATVVGTGGEVLGVRYCHAWVEVEEDDVVLELSNGNAAVIERERYYRAGRVEDIVRYTVEEACIEMLRTGHYGPWDDRFEALP